MTAPLARPSTYTDLAATDFRGFTESVLAQSERGGITLVYAPSTTTVTGVTPVDAAALAPAGPVMQTMQSPRVLSRFTVGEVTAYSGVTLMGGAALSGLVFSLLRVPMLVPLLSGVTALIGMLAAIGGAALDSRERNGAVR